MRKNGLFHGFTFCDAVSGREGLGERFVAECAENLRALGDVGVMGKVGEGGTGAVLGESYDAIGALM